MVNQSTFCITPADNSSQSVSKPRSLLKHNHEVSYLPWLTMQCNAYLTSSHPFIQWHVGRAVVHQKRHLQAAPLASKPLTQQKQDGLQRCVITLLVHLDDRSDV